MLKVIQAFAIVASLPMISACGGTATTHTGNAIGGSVRFSTGDLCAGVTANCNQKAKNPDAEEPAPAASTSATPAEAPQEVGAAE